MSPNTWRRIMAALVLCVVAAAPVRAQDDDEAVDLNTASVYVGIAQSGSATVNVSLPAAPSNRALVVQNLALALHCSPSKFASPPAWGSAKPSWSAAQRAQFEKAQEEMRARNFNAHCGPLTSRSGLLYSGRFDFLPLLRTLQADGVQTLEVEIASPQTASVTFSSAGRDNNPNPESFSSGRFAIYHFPANASAAQVSVEYGYRRSDVQRMELYSAAYVVLPLLILLWVRRSALRSAGDATDAWFSYFRAMNWCVNGAILLWCLTRLSPLRDLLDFLHFAGLNGVSGSLASMAAILGPPAVLYIGASVLSYGVFARFRGATVSRREYVLGQVLQLGTVFLPLNLFIGGALLVITNPRAGAVVMVLAVIVYMVCADLRMRLTRSAPVPVTSGELRDRIFSLAGKVGVKVKQVFIMPAARVQMANAFAARNGIVMFTDYLLQRLDKREVDAIAAHELTHLRHKHPAKLQMVMLAVILLPGVFTSILMAVVNWAFMAARLAGVLHNVRASLTVTTYLYRFDQSAWRDVIWFTLGFLGFYFLARRFEKTADLGAVAATNDGPALITGLVKVSSLNLMPLQWGRVTGATLTHPSTMRRLQYISEACNIPGAQLKELVSAATSPAAPAAVAYEGVDDRSVQVGSDRALRTVRTARKRLWILIVMHVLPATVVAWLAQTFLIVSTPGLALKAFGMVMTLILYALTIHWMGIRGRVKVRRAVLARIEKTGLKVDATRSTLVGFSPGPNPRHYVSSYDWTRGFLLLTRGRLHFIGEETRFALAASQVTSIALGPGAPSWFNYPRIYVDWRDDAGMAHTFSFSAAEPCSLFEVRHRIEMLHQRLSAWVQGVSDQVRPPAELAGLAPPAIGEVTCLSPREITSFAKFVRLYLVMVVPAAALLCLLLHLDAFLYVAGTGLLVRFYEAIPYWRYRDRVAEKAAAAKPAVQAAVAG